MRTIISASLQALPTQQFLQHAHFELFGATVAPRLVSFGASSERDLDAAVRTNGGKQRWMLVRSRAVMYRR